MIKRLNNKGYMLVEIILAFVLTMVTVYFITDITIKIKNKNDDLLVRTLVSTDQAIIYNKIMKDINCDLTNFSCSNIKIDGNKFTYKEFTNIVSEYATLKLNKCNNTSTKIEVSIGLDVPQLPEEDFDVNIEFSK